MRFEQTRDVLDHAVAFHSRLGKFYHRLSNHTEQQRLKLLLDYFSRHEKHLRRSLEDFEDETAEQLLNTWFDFTTGSDLDKLPAKTEIDPNTTVDQVIHLAMELDDHLIALYREMASRADIPELKQLFESLLKLEEQEQHRMARQALTVNDV